MRIRIDGEERAALGAEIAERARRLRESGGGPRFLAPQHSALLLREAVSEEEYDRRYARLLQMRCGVDPGDFKVPHRKGAAGMLAGWVRVLLWKLLRHQHERMAFQQNIINELLAAAVEFERRRRRRETADLRRRIEQLEKTIGRGGGAD